jgi:hypothetical protein
MKSLIANSWIIRSIRKFVGNKTLPIGAEQCELGDWWVRISWIDVPGADIYEYEYCYRKLEQNYWGKWVETDLYLQRHHGMDYYKNVKHLAKLNGVMI